LKDVINLTGNIQVHGDPTSDPDA